MKTIFLSVFTMFLPFIMTAQQDPKWDDTRSKGWPSACEKIVIFSSVDKKPQEAWFFKSKSKKARPLIVSLHTWSGDYNQEDPLVQQCIERDYNYIHPDFRGPNNISEACGSPLVISDIDDAIDYAIEHGNVDKSEIHVIGVSGGGYATMLMYMRSRQNIKTFSAWAAISNLVDWYYESIGRNSKYARDIAMATTGRKFEGEEYYFDEKEATQRSPVFMVTPVGKRKNSQLFIYTGVHDGYTGSVPITHSINFYNKIVNDLGPHEKKALIPDRDIITLLTYRGYPHESEGMLSDRMIHYQKQFEDKIRIILFEGGHEMLVDVALDHIAK